jgi:hypothetical protein
VNTLSNAHDKEVNVSVGATEAKKQAKISAWECRQGSDKDAIDFVEVGEKESRLGSAERLTSLRLLILLDDVKDLGEKTVEVVSCSVEVSFSFC